MTLSVELGHLSPRDLGRPQAELEEDFRTLRPWIHAVRQTTPSISTCVLIDDYFADPPPPSYVLPDLIAAAAKADVHLGYIVRESALTELGEALINRLPERTEARLLRSYEKSYRHSISTTIELWDEPGPQRKLSCALLAAAWQLLRLGLDEGLVGEPVLWQDFQPSRRWRRVPAILQVTRDAPPLRAVQTRSFLPSSLLPVEHAVRVIVEQVAPSCLDQIKYDFT